MNSMFPVVLFIVSLALGVLVLYWIVLRNASRKIGVQYSQLADALELELNQPDPAMGGFIRPEPSVYGTHRDREISISVPGKGLQNTRQIETVLKVQLKEERFAAQVAASGLFGGLRQRDGRGMKRWKSGDEAFDGAWDIRVAPGQHTDAVFTPEIRQRMASLLKAGKGNLYIGGGVLAYAELGLISSDAIRERFEQIIDFLFELAETIEATKGLNAGKA